MLLQGCNPVSYSCTGLWCKILKTLDFPKNTILKGGISGIAFFLLLTQKDLPIHGQAHWDWDKTIRDCSVPMEDLEPSRSMAGINHSSHFHKAEFQQKGKLDIGKIPESIHYCNTPGLLFFFPLMNRERILSITNNWEASTKDVIVHKDHFWNTDVVIKDVLAYICSMNLHLCSLLAQWAMWCFSHCPWKLSNLISLSYNHCLGYSFYCTLHSVHNVPSPLATTHP